MGHTVFRFVRRPAQLPSEITWDPSQGTVDPDSIAKVDAVIHLAGEPIFGRWTASKKKRILDSRVHGTQTIARAVARAHHPCTLVSASGVGYYGSSLTDIFSEGDPVGTGFLADVCAQWEAATKSASDAGQRVVTPRIGLVLTPDGGALKQMLLPFKAGLGGVVGSGSQWMSWISLHDAVKVLIRCALDTKLSGPVNCVGPNPVTNRTFTHALAKALRRPAILPVPAFGLKLAYGSLADETVLASQNVHPGALSAVGHQFTDTDLHDTLQQLLN